MTACTIASLTIYDMCKSMDRTMSIGELMLWEKTGGRFGNWRRPLPELEELEPLQPIAADIDDPLSDV